MLNWLRIGNLHIRNAILQAERDYPRAGRFVNKLRERRSGRSLKRISDLGRGVVFDLRVFDGADGPLGHDHAGLVGADDYRHGIVL